jgi:dolichol-phosphate mannosyltransferase
VTSYFGLVEEAIRLQERRREFAWLGRKEASQLKLRWRALSARHCFHVIPGERILEVGGGSGLWTQQLAAALRFENPITSIVFSPELFKRAQAEALPNVKFIPDCNADAELSPQSFDYIVGCGVLWSEYLPEVLATLHRLLKPGGQILFFEPNLRFPGRGIWNRLESLTGATSKTTFNASITEVLEICSHQGFTHLDLKPYDLLPTALGARWLRFFQAKTLLLEHAPLLRNFCGDMFLWARKPASEPRRLPNLAAHRNLYDSVSVVVPCRNEAPNLARIVDGLLSCYGPYIYEIILVNDGSTDDTAAIGVQIGRMEPRVKMVNRVAPNGVGLALKDGYQAAEGRYILSMDCDFLEILPDLRALFDVIAQGYDGAIGSRFSHDSILVNYPFGKMLGNRAVHVLIKLLLRDVRDITNNMKLYRTEILQNLIIESPHFSANLETGLKPLLAGYSIKEVPISWINRTVGMGSSSFNVRKVGLAYVRVLFRIWNARRLSGAKSFFKHANRPRLGDGQQHDTARNGHEHDSHRA